MFITIAFGYSQNPRSANAVYVRLEGVVVDEAGNPVVRARFDSGDPRIRYASDGAGHFSFYTIDDAFVIRAEGYRSELLRTGADSNLRIVLRKSTTSVREFPSCDDATSHLRLEGFGRFAFPAGLGFDAGQTRVDVDYGMRTYAFTLGNITGRINHAAGPLWSKGEPMIAIETLATFDEKRYVDGSSAILDVRGETTTGTRSRSLSRFGETVWYQNVLPVIAAELDRFLDGACLQGRPVTRRK